MGGTGSSDECKMQRTVVRGLVAVGWLVVCWFVGLLVGWLVGWLLAGSCMMMYSCFEITVWKFEPASFWIMG